MDSFKDIEKYWLNEVESYADPGTQLVLVGNKCDLENERAVPIDMAKQFAASKNMEFFETSAKTADHVVEAFTDITRKLFTKVEQNKNVAKQAKPEINRQKLESRLPDPQRKKGCC
jgi:Ras-related protein Rab-1A